MQIDLGQVRGEPFRWHETLEIPASSLGREELAALSPIVWHGRVSFAEPGFYFTAHLEYEQTLVCTRCLSPYVESVSADVELLLMLEEPETGRSGAAETEGEIELEEEELGVVAVSGERFEVEPVLLEQLQLNIPMKPICRPECRGICPSCGTDLNQGECSCAGDAGDPRWAALAGLRDRLSGKNE